jgi:hypothetical protein
VQVDVGVALAGPSGNSAFGGKAEGHEPAPDTARHLDRLAQEERDLLVARSQVPASRMNTSRPTCQSAQIFLV